MKKLFVYLFLLCFSLYSNAQATDLTIDNQTPGWLSSKINYGDQQTVKNLKVTGYINNTDIRFIGSLTQLSLNGVIDLGDVTIVGNSWNGHFKSPSSATSTYVTEDYSYSIQKLILPHNLTSYLEPKRSFGESSVDTLVFDTQVNKIGDYCYAYYSSYYNNSGKDNDTQYTFRRKIGHLILGENVDSLMYLPSDNPQTVHLPKSLKCIASYACKGRTDLSQWNIREFPSLEEIGYCSFTYDEPGYGHTGAIKNSATLPDSIFFPNMKWVNMACLDFKEGMHVFFGDKLEVIGSGDGGVSYPYYPSAENVSLHFKSKTPPAEIYGMHLSSSCKLYVPKGAKQVYESAFPNIYKVIEEAQPLEGIMLDKESILMEVGDETTLTATPVPENADDADFVLEVDKPEVISITQSGEIKALSSGTAVITASSVDGKFTAECKVIVKTHATEVYIDPSEVTFTKLGTMEQLQAVVLPEETFDKSVKWTSSNSSVCTVTSTGKIVAMGYGDAVIMAITNDGEIPATCVVKVTPEKYKLTYMVDNVVYKTYDVEYTSTITPEAFPTKEGYTFSGWSEIPSTMPAKDVTITGNFTLIDAIEDVIADDSTYQIYAIDGKPIGALQKGVNIIKYQNGNVKKVLVK
ncbi:MAG: Ig-like domain-containing protein [Bacteroidaceae bacterium]|nr:Ig-like domain-containing protein [Bacteroidaceae bacterium]